MTDAKVIPFRDIQGQMRDDIKHIVSTWTAEDKANAGNGEVAVLLAKGLVQMGYRKQ